MKTSNLIMIQLRKLLWRRQSPSKPKLSSAYNMDGKSSTQQGAFFKVYLQIPQGRMSEPDDSEFDKFLSPNYSKTCHRM